MSKTTSVKLPFPVSINGQVYKGLVKVEQAVADELKRIVSEAKENGKELLQKAEEKAEGK